MTFVLHATSSTGIRRGTLTTSHGVIETPVFMPVATKGALKAQTPAECANLDVQVLLANTYHLMLRPGHELIARAGGLHKFMRWNGPILTDSGGYQVFSLGERLLKSDRAPSSSRVSISEEGVEFRSHLDGTRWMITPERSIEIQQALGSDIMMCFDECPPHDASKRYHEESMERTTRWAKRCLERHRQCGGRIGESITNADQQLFGIVQGGLNNDLRVRHAHDLVDLGFDGYAVGGLAVGETNAAMYDVLDAVVPTLPGDRPRYLMGVGKPENILEAVKRGIDMFDCVLPTRNARHGTLYIGGAVPPDASSVEYTSVHLANERFREDFTILDSSCACLACTGGFTKAYLRHLLMAGEPLAMDLMTSHNIAFFMSLLESLRRIAG